MEKRVAERPQLREGLKTERYQSEKWSCSGAGPRAGASLVGTEDACMCQERAVAMGAVEGSFWQSGQGFFQTGQLVPLS